MEPGLGKKLERERLVAVPSLGYPLLGPAPTGGAVASNEVCVCRWQRPEVRSLDTETGYREVERQPSCVEGA